MADGEAAVLYLALVLGGYLCFRPAGRRAVVAYAALVVAWTLCNPGFAGTRLLRSVKRGPTYGRALIPWSSTSVSWPQVVRAQSRHEVLGLSSSFLEAATVVGSAHSFADLFSGSQVLVLDYCDIGTIENGRVNVSAGCKFDQVRAFLGGQNKVLRGLGAIYQQSVGGGVATHLHGDEARGFNAYVRGCERLEADGPTWVWPAEGYPVGTLGGKGVILTVEVEVHDDFRVRRTLSHGRTAEEVVQAIDRVRGNASVAAGGQTVGGGWTLWETVAAGGAAGSRELPARPTSTAYAFFVDNLVLPLILYCPWIARVSFDPFVARGSELWFYEAQEHHPGSVLPTGEINSENCAADIEKLIQVAAGALLSLVVRPSAEGCWIDYAVIEWQVGGTWRFHNNVYNAFPNATYHSGKIANPAAATSPGYLRILEFRRVLWIVLVTVALATAAHGFLAGGKGAE